MFNHSLVNQYFFGASALSWAVTKIWSIHFWDQAKTTYLFEMAATQSVSTCYPNKNCLYKNYLATRKVFL